MACVKFPAPVIHGWDSLGEGSVEMAGHEVAARLRDKDSVTGAQGRGQGRCPRPR